MNVVSSMLYFLGTKIQALKPLATLNVAEPSANKMSTIICKNTANGGGGTPSVVTVSVPTDNNCLLGVSKAQNGTGCEPIAISLPLSVANGGTGRTTDYADFVTEQGTKTADGKTWQYRKWNSGLIEMMCRVPITFGSTWTSVGSLYRNSQLITLPFDIPYANRFAINGSAGASGMWAFPNSDNAVSGTDKLEVMAYKIPSGTASYSVNMSIYVAGKEAE